MLESFELFVAARYLKAKRRQTVISLITVISVLGVAAGVMALVIALAVNNGFRSSLETNLLGATPHVTILEKEPSSGIADWRALCEKLRRLPGVTSAEPALYGKVFASGPQQSAEATLKGVPLDAAVLTQLRRSITKGSLDGLRGGPRVGMSGLPAIVLGSHLAEHTGMLPGAVLRVLSPQGELTPFGVRAGESQFRVAAIFESGFYDLDNQFAFVSLEDAQRLFSTGDVVNALELRLADVYDAPAVARAAESLVNADRRDKLGATQWMEQNRQLLSALRLERTVSTITIGLIQLVAALNILTALVMSVMEKRRDIAVLMALGAKQAQIARIFIAQGLLIGLCGVLFGLVSGYGLSFLADHYRWIALDEEIYSVSYVPFQPHFADALWISAAALAVSFLATLYPARAATRLMPVETLRYE
jgi:lipoprotein-releasing system permease protein